ncbi:MAG TPA: hypothetical protein VLL06_06625 [Nitrospiraceae bacterium]|nr:hypothetical protein [Nitrospiraceae bacterium]
MDSTAVLLWGLLFGSIGFGFLLYGRKQKSVVPIIAGIALCAVPYFIANVYILVTVGVVLMAIPFFVRI